MVKKELAKKNIFEKKTQKSKNGEQNLGIYQNNEGDELNQVSRTLQLDNKKPIWFTLLPWYSIKSLYTALRMEKRCAETSPGENTVGYADGSEECSRKK